MHFDFVIPVFTDTPANLWLVSKPKANEKDAAWQEVRAVSEFDFLDQLASQLRQLGHHVAFLVTMKPLEEKLRRTNSHVFNLYDGLVRRREVPDAELWDVEREYSLTSMRSFVYPERAYDWALDYDDLIPRTVHVLRYLERFVHEHSVGSFVNNVGCEQVRRCIEAIARKHGITNSIFDFAALPGRFVIASSEMGVRFPQPEGAFSEEELGWARDFVRSMLSERKPWAPASPLGFGLANFKGAAQAVMAMRHQKDVSVKRLMGERVRRVARRGFGSALWQEVVPGERYIFFPLHLWNDSAITVRSPQFQYQEQLVRFIAERALPAGTKLYVKPHIGARDAFSVDMLASIRRTPNVRLIAPATNPHDLIQNAMMTLVINSTAGFESILHGKPTVVLGKPWYSGQGLSIDVESVDDVPQAIERALTFTPSRERLVRFIAHYRRFTREGVYGIPEHENVSRFAGALAERLRERTNSSAARTAHARAEVGS